MTNSYDFNNPIRDVSPEFDTLIANSPSLLRLFGSLNPNSTLNIDSPVVTNNTYEWIDDVLTAVATTITGFDTDGDGTGINVASTDGIEAGSILRFSTSADVTRTEQVQVTSVDSATDLTVVRDYAGSAHQTFVIGDKVFLNSTPRNEGSGVGPTRTQQGSIVVNYTEIFDEPIKLTRTAQASNTYDQANSLARQQYAAMVRLTRKLENALLHGLPLQRTPADQGTMGGLIHFLSQVGGNVNSTGGAISQTLINDVIEDISAKGGMLIDPVLVCSPNQARRISAFNTSGSNPITYRQSGSTSTGEFVTSFIGDLPINGNGTTAQVFVAQDMWRDQVLVLDASKFRLRPMSPLAVKTLPEMTDGTTQRMLTELTLEVNNAKESHGILTGLSV